MMSVMVGTRSLPVCRFSAAPFPGSAFVIGDFGEAMAPFSVSLLINTHGRCGEMISAPEPGFGRSLSVTELQVSPASRDSL
jgi:hypothetical protein